VAAGENFRLSVTALKFLEFNVPDVENIQSPKPRLTSIAVQLEYLAQRKLECLLVQWL
jgi:hypothetical protein